MALGKLWEKKYEENFFFASLKVKISEERSRIRSCPDPEPDPDPEVRGTDPGIRSRIRTKMSRIPNTGFNDQFREWTTCLYYCNYIYNNKWVFTRLLGLISNILKAEDCRKYGVPPTDPAVYLVMDPARDPSIFIILT